MTSRFNFSDTDKKEIISSTSKYKNVKNINTEEDDNGQLGTAQQTPMATTDKKNQSSDEMSPERAHLKKHGTPDFRYKENRADSDVIPENNHTSSTRRDSVRRSQSEYTENFDKFGHHLKEDGTHDMRFKENREGHPEDSEADEDVLSNPKQLGTSNIKHSPRNQGEFSGMYDEYGHHLKDDGTHDMRFKENRERNVEDPEEEHEESGSEQNEEQTPMTRKYTRLRARTPNDRKQGEFSGKYDKYGHPLKKEGTHDMRYKVNREHPEVDSVVEEEEPGEKAIFETEAYRDSPRNQGEFSGKFDRYGRHLKRDGTPDKRFKENRDIDLDVDYEKDTARRSRKMSYNSVAPKKQGEFTEKFDRHGYPLKSDGTPDMRFKENREEFAGEGYEEPMSKGRTPTKNYEPNRSFQTDSKGHNLTYEGKHDMRFKENRDRNNISDTEEETPQRTRKSYGKSGASIKKPATPYAQYIKEELPEMKEEYQNLHPNDIFRLLGERWRKMSEKEKSKYYQMYDEEKAEMSDFKTNRKLYFSGTPKRRYGISSQAASDKKGKYVSAKT